MRKIRKIVTTTTYFMNGGDQQLSAAELELLGHNDGDDFVVTTIRPVDESGPSTSAGFFFPHFAGGDGYTTQFSLFAGLAGQTTSGTVRFSNTSGEAISLPVQ